MNENINKLLQEISNNFNNINTKIDDIQQRMRTIEDQINAISKDTKNMNNHINFVENIYNVVKTPFKNVLDYYYGKDIKIPDTKRIE
jgi:predicted  nucleic acid-binding Zn-ribbon protein